MIAFREINDLTAYLNGIWDRLLVDELPVEAVYQDTASPTRPTIGVGFNLQDAAVRVAVFDVLLGPLNTVTNPADRALDEEYRTQLANIIGTNNSGIIQDQLNAVMDDRRRSTGYIDIAQDDRRAAFTFSSGGIGLGEMRQVFNAIYTTYETQITNWISVRDADIPAEITAITSIPQSEERAVLFSLAYNGLLTQSNNLREAIQSDNRARAWYEIRFNSNPVVSPAEGGTGPDGRILGVFNRRVRESNDFGLYNDPENIEAEEAKNAVRYIEFRRTRIETYLSQIVSRSIDGNHTAVPQEPDIFLEPQLNIGKQLLIDEFAAPLGADLTVESQILIGDEVNFGLSRDDTLDGSEEANLIFGEQGSDTLNGNGGNDALYGGTGTDTLNGGEGDDALIGGDRYYEDDNAVDTLNGGAGADDYYVGNGDIVTDSERGDRVFHSGARLFSGLRSLTHPENEFRSVDGRFIYTRSSSDLLVQDLITSASFTLQNYEDGDFAINKEVRMQYSEFTRTWMFVGSAMQEQLPRMAA